MVEIKISFFANDIRNKNPITEMKRKKKKKKVKLSSNALHLVGNGSVVGDELGVASVGNNTSTILEGGVLITGKSGETPLLGDDDLLTSGELELATTESLQDDGLVGILATNGHENLTNIHTGNGSLGLSESTSHTGLKSISSGT